MTHRLKYTGSHAQVFQTGNVGLLEPGAEFDVPDELLRRFMRRPDIEHAVECPSPPCRCGDEPQPRPEASEDASRRQDGDTSGGTPSGRRGRSGSPSGKNGTGEQ